MNVRPLPFLNALCAEHEHVVLFWDERVEGRALLGVGARKSMSVAKPTNGDWALWEAFLLEGRQREAWTVGWIGYDMHHSLGLTNQKKGLEEVVDHPGGWPLLMWWEPEVIVEWKPGQVDPQLIAGESLSWAAEVLRCVHDQTQNSLPHEGASKEADWQPLTPRWTREGYRAKFETVHRALRRGDIYEMNLCMPWVGRAPGHASWSVFERLAARTKAPHSAYVQAGNWRSMCASPERFLRKRGDRLQSQPIKGTVRRGSTLEEDAALKKVLSKSEKEQAENVMIVDLVRNDLSRVAAKNSVEVDELFGIHSFATVHQMISSVSCVLRDDASPLDILRATFPMGSMTGAPKLSAMTQISRLEETGRGVYSGSFGYLEPNGDWDFNVVIRSLMHRVDTGRVDATVGGAITLLSEADAEFDECLLKAEALHECLIP